MGNAERCAPERHVPARQYNVNGERRSSALLRPITDTAAQERIRDLLLEAFSEYEQELVRTA